MSASGARCVTGEATKVPWFSVSGGLPPGSWGSSLTASGAQAVTGTPLTRCISETPAVSEIGYGTVSKRTTRTPVPVELRALVGWRRGAGAFGACGPAGLPEIYSGAPAIRKLGSALTVGDMTRAMLLIWVTLPATVW